MKRAPFLLLLGLLATCDGPILDGDPHFTLPHDGVDGPPISAIEGPVVPVEVRAGGRVLLDGRTVELMDLREALRSIADSAREESGDPPPSRVALLVRADYRTRFQEVEPVLRVARYSDVGIRRIFFVVEPFDATEERAFAWPGPERIDAPASLDAPVVDVGGRGESVPIEGLAAYARREAPARVDVRPAPDLRLGTLLAAVQALRNGGVDDIAVPFSLWNWRHLRESDGDDFSGSAKILVGGLALDDRGELPDRDRAWIAGAPPEKIRDALDTLPAPPGPLELLALLAAGADPRLGPHRRAVLDGLERLRKRQARDGLFPGEDGKEVLAAHAISTLVMVRAAAAPGSTGFESTAQRALGRLAKWKAPGAYEGADWAATAFVAGRRAGLRVPDERVEWATVRLGTPPGEIPTSTDPADWLPGLLHALHAGGEVAARWRAALDARLGDAPLPESAGARALRTLLFALAWREGRGR